MKQVNGKQLNMAVLLALFAAMLPPAPVMAKGSAKEWAIPILMEESTVRGKVAILETRRQDRRVVAGLKVSVWEPEEDDPAIRRKLIHKTTTDEDGFFSLPLLQQGAYILMISDLRLQLKVVPASTPAPGTTAEPKILLLLLPKEVI